MPPLRGFWQGDAAPCPQGVALGCPMPPLRGFFRLPSYAAPSGLFPPPVLCRPFGAERFLVAAAVGLAGGPRPAVGRVTRADRRNRCTPRRTGRRHRRTAVGGLTADRGAAR